MAVLHAHGQTAAPDTALPDKPARAISRALETAGWSVEDLDFVEIDEAFASVSVHSAAQLGIGMDRVNVNGGAIALGHPIGASGARVVVAAVYELQRRGTGKAAVMATADWRAGGNPASRAAPGHQPCGQRHPVGGRCVDSCRRNQRQIHD